MKEFIPDGSSAFIGDMICEDGSVMSDNKSKVNHFSDFFAKIGAKLANKFPACDTSHISLKMNSNSFQFKPFTHKQINKVVHSQSVNKSSGLDGACVRLLKEGLPILADKLLFIFNLSISTGSVSKA